jgi:hypothetical protein
MPISARLHGTGVAAHHRSKESATNAVSWVSLRRRPERGDGRGWGGPSACERQTVERRRSRNRERDALANPVPRPVRPMSRAVMMSRTRSLLLLEAGLFIAMLAAWSIALTGLAAHEWLGFGVGASLIVHISLQWRWVANAVRRLSGAGAGRLRTSFMLNAALFVAATSTIFSGVLISEVAARALGLAATPSLAWHRIHGLSQNLMTCLLGLHSSLNWRLITMVLVRPPVPCEPPAMREALTDERGVVS